MTMLIPAGKQVEVLVDHAFWSSLGLSSIIATERDTFYLDLSHGIAKVKKIDGSYRVTGLLPHQAFVDLKPQLRGK